MSREETRIPFQVDVSRIIEVLARQIYQSPLALLRENTQNAFDAILLRVQRGDVFTPRIDVTLGHDQIVIEDNGIGMTADDLRNHFWRAGSSSKNSPEARDAGVVGTFGIGAMANFGIADHLTVETESAVTGERTDSEAERATLSTTEDTISLRPRESTGEPGTKISAHIEPGPSVDVQEAVAYITDFVAFVDIPVYVNETLVSRKSLDDAVPPPTDDIVTTAGVTLSPRIVADVSVGVSPSTGDLWVRLDAIQFGNQPVRGTAVFRQGAASIRAFRSGFGLSTVAVSSQYQFGGVANLQVLEPTAGRESLTTNSLQLLQELVSGIESVASEVLATRREADLNTNFLQWVRSHGKYEMCGNIRARVEPGTQQIRLDLLREDSATAALLVYGGTDQSIIDACTSDDRRLVVIAAANPRRACVSEYLNRYCRTEPVQDSPTVLSRKAVRNWTMGERALTFRIQSILETDYFLPATVIVGTLSHGLPIVVTESAGLAELVIDSSSPTFATLIQVHDSDYAAFPSMAKDVVRNVVFPRVADLVPSSTKQGAEAFLRSIRRTKDTFEYEYGDTDSLSSVWDLYLEGSLTMAEVTSRATAIIARNVQIVDDSASRRMRDVLPDVVENEAVLSTVALPGAAPPILRTDVQSDAKLLTVEPSGVPVRGFRTFIALSDRAHDERGEFFLQPHATSVIWGGQRLLFIFEHHSGEFGLYYDLQTASSVAETSGGGPFPTATIVLKNRIYLPIPEVVASSFVPAPGERKRFDVRSDLLFTEKGPTS